VASTLGIILESAKSITSKIIKVLKDTINERLFRKAPKIQVDLRKLIEDAIKAQPEYSSLMGGTLQSELGVPHTGPRLDQIIRLVVDSIVVKVNKLKPTGDQIFGGLEIQFVKSNFKDLLNSPAATYVTDKGQTIEWLRWLLLEGDKIIIRQYRIGIDPKNYARTGLGEIMINSTGKQGGWSVPSQYAGTVDNNFITRALISVANDIDKLIANSLNGN
jgi:hypothetical protein